MEEGRPERPLVFTPLPDSVCLSLADDHYDVSLSGPATRAPNTTPQSRLSFPQLRVLTACLSVCSSVCLSVSASFHALHLLLCTSSKTQELYSFPV